MAALTAKKNVPERSSEWAQKHDAGVAANAVIHQGAMLVYDANGYLAPATAATGLTAAGRAEESVDNTGGANGDKVCRFRSGIFKVENSGANAIAQADVGSDCYFEDDQTVGSLATGMSVAGKVYELAADGDIFVAVPGPGLA